MARELLTTYKMTQQEAADILGITQAAVSQYSRQSRGSKVKMLESQKGLMKMIDLLTKDIVDKKVNARE
ncbi:MAG: transcriptional regulator, partial [Candidatus Aenigmarchaeota archaeon]|nr:transcriptional regulator [Candidatus Aenigmarchaeota archaeon]